MNRGTAQWLHCVCVSNSPQMPSTDKTVIWTSLCAEEGQMKGDKLYITTNKGVREEHCGTLRLDLSHVTNDTIKCWIIYVINVQSLGIYLRGKKCFPNPWYSLLGTLHLTTSRWRGCSEALPVCVFSVFIMMLVNYIRVQYLSAGSPSEIMC